MTRPSDPEEALRRAAPKDAVRIAETLNGAGHASWLVGGSVRDVLLALARGDTTFGAKDWDFATSATPEQVMKLFRRVIPTGIAHGTVTVVLGGAHYEVTTLRGETTYSDGRRPDRVFFVADLTEDLARRDFTVNALAFDVLGGTLHDPFGGREDLDRKLLRAVGEPARRFAEDGLRVLRCARFAATLGFDVEQETRRAIRPSLETYRKVALERVRDEWLKALRSSAPSRFLALVRSEGMLDVTLPELFEGTTEALFDDTLALLDRSDPDALRRISLLLVRGLEDPTLADGICRRLKLSNDERARVVRLVEHSRIPAFLGAPLLSARPIRAEVRRYLRAVGAEHLADVSTLLRELGHDTTELISACSTETGAGAPLNQKDLAINGKDLLEAGIVTPGPSVGRVLATLLESVLDDPELNQRDALLELARRL